MDILTYEQASKLAVFYWSSHLESNNVESNTGDNENGWFATLGRSVLRKPFTQGDIVVFEHSLTSLVRESLETNYHASVIIDVDYHPCILLMDALKLAGCENKSFSAFPLKTVMWVRLDKVSFRQGYGADEKIIYGYEDELANYQSEREAWMNRDYSLWISEYRTRDEQKEIVDDMVQRYGTLDEAWNYWRQKPLRWERADEALTYAGITD